MPARLKRLIAVHAAMERGPLAGAAIGLSRMPVLAEIHSPDLSTRRARSSFVTRWSGTYAPTPVIRMPIEISRVPSFSFFRPTLIVRRCVQCDRAERRHGVLPRLPLLQEPS